MAFADEKLLIDALKSGSAPAFDELVRCNAGRMLAAARRILRNEEDARDGCRSDKFYGCMFINAIGEYSDPDSPIREVCKEFKRLMRGYLRELADAAGASDPAALADELALLLEGATVTAQVSGDRRAAQTAKRIARSIIDEALEAG